METPVILRPKRQRRDRILYAAVALVLAALALDGAFGAHGLIATYRLRLQVQQAQQKTERLARENQEFANQVRQLKSDPSAIERVAREQMGLVKPGELVFKLPPKSPSEVRGSSAAKPNAAAPNNSSGPGH